MIYDRLENAALYYGLSEGIRRGLLFLQTIDGNIENGTYLISDDVKAIVSEYYTLDDNINGYECHKQFVDIQYLVQGREKMCFITKEKLKEKVPYNQEKDIAFFSSPEQPINLTLGDGYFTILYPQDGHMPQLSIEKSIKVKKIVVKVLINRV